MSCTDLEKSSLWSLHFNHVKCINDCTAICQSFQCWWIKLNSMESIIYNVNSIVGNYRFVIEGCGELELTWWLMGLCWEIE